MLSVTDGFVGIQTEIFRSDENNFSGVISGVTIYLNNFSRGDIRLKYLSILHENNSAIIQHENSLCVMRT